MTTPPVQCPRCKRVDWKEPHKGITRDGERGDARSEVAVSRNSSLGDITEAKTGPRRAGSSPALATTIKHAAGCRCLMCHKGKK